jgi:hypothetical protein
LKRNQTKLFRKKRKAVPEMKKGNDYIKEQSNTNEKGRIRDHSK